MLSHNNQAVQLDGSIVMAFTLVDVVIYALICRWAVAYR
ncbi:hypothetical protein VC0101557_06780 [Vibrio cholerae VC0101557]|uniref:Uncharacterized protein n=1 Tax=Vibrio cholerae serotype O1 (strain ATCC 39541 / Classical Ogawa 395 / O395) TaxID=345073 RepID=A0A0H3AKW9_VIBC3|nr:hypothetical protein VC0395_A2641 [Vibrio cholerae O395]APF47877.1 hypothetical protein ASZ80_00275 [Vibrio cholerae]EAZ73553.1 hypothetical protein A5C_0291 [Vibrio cholerae NCTC 8457]EAZ77886.1 hypothetical protein A5E_0279 [Vibrio cholerae B33]EET93725.1 hypothetical protein VCH_000372 [Vibrio cholerae CIRS101]EEY42265.1 hypothetical protein VIJ_001209 [Vibrio cholerae RC27]EEY46992.1 hypothetical protein VIG_003132 [Vibrio cholerae INDRE 91/1]EGR06422.1 putative membrane protein [Vibr